MAERRGLGRDLGALGVEPGTTLCVHASLSAIGRVAGGAATVVSALLDVLGDSGTLAMPAATPRCAEPDAPEFDARTTPTTMGAIAECFRTWPGTLRSDHPLESVCARGPLAAEITREHPLAFSEGPGSPFARLCERDARILLLGVGFNRCTALHLAESLASRRRVMQVGFWRTRDGRRTRVEVPNVADDNDTHFPSVGERFVAAGKAREGRIGQATSTLVRMRELVDFAREYFETVL